MSSKSKSTPNGTPSNSTPATPRISRVSRAIAKSDADSPSPSKNLHSSVDKSVRSAITSKPSVERRTSKLSNLPDKKPTRILKPSELQAELNVAREDLKKAKEMLALVEKEKVQALEEVKEAQKMSEEANEKLREALVARKQAEENSEIEMFRAAEMEQVGIEAAQKKEEEWQNEVEAVRNQHAVDVASLLSATQELQRVKRELAMACEAKNKALRNAEDATKIAETHAEKVEILSAELVRLKSLLDSRISWNETEANEKNKLVEDLKLEIEILKEELERAKSYEAQLVEKEAIVKQFNVDLEAAKKAESYAHNVLEEWKKKVEELDSQAEEARHLERSASATLESVMKQLEESNDLVHDAASEIAYLKEKVRILEMSMVRQKDDLEESEHHAQMAKEEASELRKKLESLVCDFETAKEEKIQAMENEKLAAASVQTLLEEKNRLVNDLERSREEEEKSKKAMESLTSALHDVSSEAREAKERWLSNQADQHEHYETQLEDLKLELKATEEKYESMLDEAKEKLDVLTNSIEQSKDGLEKWKADWKEKELHLMSCLNKTEEENSSMEKEINRLVDLLKDAEKESSAKKDEVYLKNSLRKSESEVTFLKEVLGEAKNEITRLKERLSDKENEVLNIIRENEELRTREAASLKKVEELSILLEESLAKNEPEASGDLSDSEKDYDMLPKKVKFSDQMEQPKMELPPYQYEQPVDEKPEQVKITSHDEADLKASKVAGNSNGKLNELESKAKEDDDLETDEHKMWEREAEQEEKSECYENGDTSPIKQQNLKKKKPLFHKFGNLLKKKNTSSQK